MAWPEETMLAASDAADLDQFGQEVRISADGSIIVVSAPSQGATDVGKVYVYTGSSWATETMLTASDKAASDFFGWSVAISADGSVIAVGAYLEDGAGTPPNANRGKVYVYYDTSVIYSVFGSAAA